MRPHLQRLHLPDDQPVLDRSRDVRAVGRQRRRQRAAVGLRELHGAAAGAAPASVGAAAGRAPRRRACSAPAPARAARRTALRGARPAGSPRPLRPARRAYVGLDRPPVALPRGRCGGGRGPRQGPRKMGRIRVVWGRRGFGWRDRCRGSAGPPQGLLRRRRRRQVLRAHWPVRERRSPSPLLAAGRTRCLEACGHKPPSAHRGLPQAARAARAARAAGGGRHRAPRRPPPALRLQRPGDTRRRGKAEEPKNRSVAPHRALTRPDPRLFLPGRAEQRAVGPSATRAMWHGLQ
jgi:hypothetical protein